MVVGKHVSPISERQRREAFIHPFHNQPKDNAKYISVGKEKKPETQKQSDDPRQQGEQEAQKEAAKKEKSDKEKIENLIKHSNRILLKISSVFPFDLFPTTITIEDTKIVITFHPFFGERQAQDIDIKNITNIFVGHGPFFSFLEIISSTPTENKIDIRKLRKKDSLKARNIIEGLRTLQREEVSTTSFEKQELLQKLDQLAKKDIS